MNLHKGYRAPLDFGSFFGQKKFDTSSVQRSIADYVHLILITGYGEYDFDPDFGCEVWEYEFEHHQATTIWKGKIEQRIKAILEKSERRLKDIEVKIDMDQKEFEVLVGGKGAKRMKKKIKVLVTGKLRATNEAFSTEDNMLLSPFLMDEFA